MRHKKLLEIIVDLGGTSEGAPRAAKPHICHACKHYTVCRQARDRIQTRRAACWCYKPARGR